MVRRFGVLALVGLGMLIGSVLFGGIGLWSLWDARRFAATAVHAQGVVTRLDWSDVAYPRGRFVAEGRTVEFRGQGGSSPPAYCVGGRVSVLYHPGQLGRARIESFWDQYLLALVFGITGVVLLILGSALLLTSAVRGRRRRRARELGIPIKAQVVEVRRDTVYKFNGESP